MDIPLFQVVFDDNSTFNGGDYQNTRWEEIPNKKIRTLFYLLPTGDYLGLGGYNKYYHFIECTEDLTGKRAGIRNMETAYMIGQRIDNTIIYKVDLRTGCINLRSVKNDDEFVTKLNQDYWK